MAVDGNYKATISTPMGAQDVTIALAASGSDLTGTISGRQGTMPIKEGRVGGNKVSWKIDINGPMGPMTLTTTATIDGDAISGTVQLGAFGNAPMKGSRA
jgi:hypothetical protein